MNHGMNEYGTILVYVRDIWGPEQEVLTDASRATYLPPIVI